MCERCKKKDCDGVVAMRPDPYMEDVFGLKEYMLLCEGQYTLRADEI